VKDSEETYKSTASKSTSSPTIESILGAESVDRLIT
jgi:hypothetical protein